MSVDSVWISFRPIERLRSVVVICTLVLLDLSFPACAADGGNRFTPALFGSGPDSLVAQIQCPAGAQSGDKVTLICQAPIMESGKAQAGSVFCFADDPKHEVYADRAMDAVRAAAFVPATVDGTPTRVYFSFRVLVTRDRSGCDFVAIPNLAPQDESIGDYYVAPQEILSRPSWYTRSEKLGHGLGDILHQSRGVLFSMSVAVSTNGAASDARIETNNGIDAGEVRAALDALGQSTFIPGFYKGRPSTMRYVELFYLR